MVKKVLVGYAVDIDAVAGWLGSYGGEDSSSDISRGMFSLALFQYATDTNQKACGRAQLEYAVC